VRLIWIGLGISSVGLLALGHAESQGAFYAATLVLGAGSALVMPSVASALSRRAGPDEQGPVAGFSSSAQAFGRMMGPLIGTELYEHVGRSMPYIVSSVVLMGLCVVAVLALSRSPALDAHQRAG
jgi:MFS family permease